MKILGNLNKLKSLHNDVFEAILRTDIYGIDRKVFAIEKSAGIEEDFLHDICPRRTCGIGISPAESVTFLRKLKKSLQNEPLDWEAEYDEIKRDINKGSYTFLAGYPEGGSMWGRIAFSRIMERLGLENKF